MVFFRKQQPVWNSVDDYNKMMTEYNRVQNELDSVLKPAKC